MSNETSSTDAFDVWRWVANQTHKQSFQRGKVPTASPEPAAMDKPAAPIAVSDATPVANDQERLTYLTVRSLGLRQEMAVEKTGIRLRVATNLEAVLPPENLVATAVRRGRQGPQARGQAANINMALSDTGLILLSWLRGMELMESREYSMIKQTFFREEPQRHRLPDKVIFWRRIADSLPSALSVHVRIGAKHLAPAEISRMTALAPAVKLVPDPRIGERPVVSLFLRNEQNLVVSARLTAVARSYCLAIDALSHFDNTGGLDAG